MAPLDYVYYKCSGQWTKPKIASNSTVLEKHSYFTITLFAAFLLNEKNNNTKMQNKT